MARLTANTALTNPDTLVVTPLTAGDEVPEWAEGMVGDHLLDAAPEAAAQSADGEDATSTPDESWTVADLREYAKANDIDLHGATSKADILAAING